MKAQLPYRDGSGWIHSFSFTWIPPVSPENIPITTLAPSKEQVLVMGTELCSVDGGSSI